MGFKGLVKIKSALLSLGLCFSLNVSAAYFTGTYSHFSDGETLEAVLADFSRAQGLSVQISSAVSGSVHGRFENINPKVFLDAIRTAYGVRYYVIGKTIYFYHENEETRTLFKPSSLGPDELRRLLASTQLASSDLPFVVDENGFIVFYGPASYVETMINVAREFDLNQGRTVVMEVVKLKHAKAHDLQIASMDSVVNVPGVATILQAMVTGGLSGGGVMQVTTQSPRVQGLRGSGMASIGGVPAMAASAAIPPRDPNANPAEGFAPNIIADTRQNAVLIQDYGYRIPYYKQVIADLDVPLRLVELHAAIVDVDIAATNELGIDWQAARSKGHWGVAGGMGSPNAWSGSTSWDGSTNYITNSSNSGIISTIFESSYGSFMAQVQMLEENNKARTLGRPSILTMDNIEATLENTTTQYVPISGQESSDLYKVETGTVLRVTPHIIDDPETGDVFIQMVISLQTNEDTDGDSLNTSETTSGQLYVAPVSQTKINTQALVRQGQSLLLGGYYVESVTESNSGIPGLKNVPFLGALFGSDSTQTSTRERLLLITPRVVGIDEVNIPEGVDDPAFAVSPTQDNYEKRERKESGGCAASTDASQAPQQIEENTSSSGTRLVNELNAAGSEI